MSSCDAGSGCSISCSGGCAAIYWHDTGECYTACYNTKAAPIAAALSGTLSIAVCEMPAGALAGLLAQTALGPRLAGLLRSSAPISLKLEEAGTEDVIAALLAAASRGAMSSGLPRDGRTRGRA